jgi:hypothetical protein
VVRERDTLVVDTNGTNDSILADSLAIHTKAALHRDFKKEDTRRFVST